MNIYALELTRIPRASLKVLLRLAKTLRRDTPQLSNPIIDAAAADLDEKIEATHKAVVARIVAGNPDLSISEAEFDWAVDGLWMLLSRVLEGEQSYAHLGLDRLSPARAEAVQLPALRARAEQARRLHSLLFGGMNMAELVRAPFLVQVESMADLLRVIDDQGLEPELEQLVGPHLLPLLRACQAQYEEMVHARLTRQRSAAVNLSTLRNELRIYITNYVSAVHSLVRPGQPETGEQVLAALRPILSLRALVNRSSGSSSGGGIDEQLEDFVELELPDAALGEDEAGEAEDVAESA